MSVPDIVALAAGVFLVLLGSGLMAYGAVSGRPKGAAGEAENGRAGIIDALARLGKVFIELVSVVDKARAGGVGLVLVVLGLGLIGFVLYMSGLPAAAAVGGPTN